MIAGLIAADAIGVGIACGVEAMSRVPLGTAARARRGHARGPHPGTSTCPTSSSRPSASRSAAGSPATEIDAFGLAPRPWPSAAWAQGRFDREVDRGAGQGRRRRSVVDRDQGLRETSLEALARLKPVLEGGAAHGRHLVADLRRRRRGAARRRGPGPGTRAAAAGPDPGPVPGRRRAVLPPRRPGPGHRAGARAQRHDDRRHRPVRGQRGVRVGRAVLAARCTGPTRTG